MLPTAAVFFAEEAVALFLLPESAAVFFFGATGVDFVFDLMESVPAGFFLDESVEDADFPEPDFMRSEVGFDLAGLFFVVPLSEKTSVS